jgi:hypothetical protein
MTITHAVILALIVFWASAGFVTGNKRGIPITGMILGGCFGIAGWWLLLLITRKPPKASKETYQWKPPVGTGF